MSDNALIRALMSFGQGASNAVASNVSAPVDGLAWLLRKGGLPIPQNPVGGSDWMAQQGLTATPQNRIAGLLGETAGMVGPAVVQAAAPKIAGGLLALDDKAMDMARQGIERRMDASGMRLSAADPTDYRGSHRAPMKDGGSSAPLHDLTKIYPDDIYSPQAAQYYGHYGSGSPLDAEGVRLLQAARNRPNMPVTMYRAVPKEATAAEQLAKLEKDMAAFMKRGKTPADSPLKGSAWYNDAWEKRNALQNASMTAEAPRLNINNGDWVTLSRAYAKEHGEGALGGKYQILSKKVPARKLFTDGNSIHEFGYDESGKALLEMMGLLGVGTAAGLGAYELSKDRKP